MSRGRVKRGGYWREENKLNGSERKRANEGKGNRKENELNWSERKRMKGKETKNKMKQEINI